MIRGQGTSELWREKKRSHQWRGVGKIPEALLGTRRRAIGLHSVLTSEKQQNPVCGEGGDKEGIRLEANYLLAHISEDKEDGVNQSAPASSLLGRLGWRLKT